MKKYTLEFPHDEIVSELEKCKAEIALQTLHIANELAEKNRLKIIELKILIGNDKFSNFDVKELADLA